MHIGLGMTISGFGYRATVGGDFGALAVANGLGVVGYFRADLGVTGTSGTGKASWANQSGAMGAITPDGSATNGIGSVSAGLGGKAGLLQDGSTQKGMFTAPALSAPFFTNLHKYWVARQITTSGIARGILQETVGNFDVYMSSATTVVANGTGAAGLSLTNNVFQRYRASWIGNVAGNEFKLGNLAAVTGSGANFAPNTARTMGGANTNYEWLMYLELTGPKANFLTFATAADAMTQTVWTSAIEI